MTFPRSRGPLDAMSPDLARIRPERSRARPAVALAADTAIRMRRPFRIEREILRTMTG